MNPNKFLTLLMGECWHVFKKKLDYDLCKLCGYRRSASWQEQYPDHLSNPLPVIRWMEKEMPGVLDDYLHWCFQRPRTSSLADDIFFILNLENLASYLKSHPEWGEKECEFCKPDAIYDPINNATKCPKCNGSGLIVHAALRYARSQSDKEEG